MAKLITLPDGNAVSPAVINSVFYYQGKGVMCRDAQQRVVSYIPISDEELGMRVRDLLILATSEGSKLIQPDWSFLDEEN